MEAQYSEMISAYREADLNQRLDMFLAFPDLRSKFGLIDQEELLPETGRLLGWPDHAGLNKIRKIMGTKIRLLKRKLSTASA